MVDMKKDLLGSCPPRLAWKSLWVFIEITEESRVRIWSSSIQRLHSHFSPNGVRNGRFDLLNFFERSLRHLEDQAMSRSCRLCT